MRNRTLIFLYNHGTKLYIKSHHETDILWCENWTDAEDFSSIFFLLRFFLRLKLQKMSSIKLRWKRWLVYEGRGVV